MFKLFRCMYCSFQGLSFEACDSTPLHTLPGLEECDFPHTKSCKIIHNKCTPTAHLNILRCAFCSMTGIKKKKKKKKKA